MFAARAISATDEVAPEQGLPAVDQPSSALRLVAKIVVLEMAALD